MGNEFELLKRRFKREKIIRLQAERIAEEKSRELYVKGIELENALVAESQARQEIEILYQEVERLSRIDPLTELFNRRSFIADGFRLLQLAIRHQNELSFAMLDIDLFKQVNDTYGHNVGDKVLVAVAKECNRQIRKTDLLARFGGEEFCILFSETDIKCATFVAERIRIAISKLKFEHENKEFSITISIGVSKLVDRYDTLEDLLKRSDDSLYLAKENGRNCVVTWEGVS